MYLVPNLSAGPHNHYLFTRKLNKKGEPRNQYEQTIQGPLVNGEIEVDDSDVDVVCIFEFRKGKLANMYPHMVIESRKLFSLKQDYDKHIKWGNEWFKYDYAKLKPSSAKSSRVLYTDGWLDSRSIGEYMPGGRVTLLDDDPDLAKGLYNDFLKYSASNYMKRLCR